MRTNSAPSGRCGAEERLARKFQGRNGLVVVHGREVLEKVGEWVPALEIVDERLDRDAYADEHR